MTARMHRTLAMVAALALTQMGAAPSGGFVVTMGPNGGGTFSTSCGGGCHAGDCFSFLTVQAGTVAIDKQDVVKSCDMVAKH